MVENIQSKIGFPIKKEFCDNKKSPHFHTKHEREKTIVVYVEDTDDKLFWKMVFSKTKFKEKRIIFKTAKEIEDINRNMSGSGCTWLYSSILNNRISINDEFLLCVDSDYSAIDAYSLGLQDHNPFMVWLVRDKQFDPSHLNSFRQDCVFSTLAYSIENILYSKKIINHTIGSLGIMDSEDLLDKYIEVLERHKYFFILSYLNNEMDKYHKKTSDISSKKRLSDREIDDLISIAMPSLRSNNINTLVKTYIENHCIKDLMRGHNFESYIRQIVRQIRSIHLRSLKDDEYKTFIEREKEIFIGLLNKKQRRMQVINKKNLIDILDKKILINIMLKNDFQFKPFIDIINNLDNFYDTMVIKNSTS